jgi:hypothetical protein
MQTRIRHIPDVGVVEVFERKSDILWSMATERGLPGPPIKGDDSENLGGLIKISKKFGQYVRTKFLNFAPICSGLPLFGQ